MSPCVPVSGARRVQMRRLRGGQQVGTGRLQARGSRGALRRLLGGRPVVGGAVRCERGISPPRDAPDISVAWLQQLRCDTRHCGTDRVRGCPSQEPAVHRPSFPAAAVIFPDASLVSAAWRSDRVVRSVVRESESDESRKMIRAPSTLSARAYCVSTKSVCMRAQIARCRRHDAHCVVRVSHSRRHRGAQRIAAMRVLLPPRRVRAAGGDVVSRAAAAARRGAVRRRCRRTADGSAGCRRPVRAHAPPSR